MILIDQLKTYHPRLLSYAAIFVTLYFLDQLGNIRERMKEVIHWKDNDLVQILRVLIYYKRDIQFTFFEKNYFPNSIKGEFHHDKVKKSNLMYQQPFTTYRLVNHMSQTRKRKAEELLDGDESSHPSLHPQPQPRQPAKRYKKIKISF